MRDIIGLEKKGFTLIELMITMAIIGILATIAIGSFMPYQARAKQSEVKVNLGSIGNLAEAYKVEYDTYVASFSNLGWAPNTITRYRYWYNGVNAVNTPTSPEAGVNYSDPGSGASTLTFTAAAVGNVDSDSTSDIWIYRENRDLSNTQNDPVTP